MFPNDVVWCPNRNSRSIHRDRGNINDTRDTQRETTDRETGTQMTNGTSGHREYK